MIYKYIWLCHCLHACMHVIWMNYLPSKRKSVLKGCRHYTYLCDTVSTLWFFVLPGDIGSSQWGSHRAAQGEHRRPDRIYFKSQFRSSLLTRTTTCNVCLRPTQPVCNYTDLRTGEPWFCYKPENMSCDTRISNYNGGYKKNLTTMEKLFQRWALSVVLNFWSD